MSQNNKPKNEDAIIVQNVSKQFVIPHDRTNTLKGAFVNLFHKNNSEIFDALKDISFEVKKGEFFGIIGRNGSGKSTLLKIIAGIYNTDTGHIKVNGRISPFLELGIGFNPELSGRDNVYLNATVLGLTEKQIDEKFESIIAFSELGRFIDQKLKNYSSGMQVRLAFSVAIHANRDILLMDEVLAVGDSNFQSKCLTEFSRYKEMGKTVILVTHDIGTVQRYCDRAMLLRDGKIEMIGNPEEVGNAYIYQNMSDEEKRIYDEEKKKISKAEKNLANLKGQDLEDETKRISEEKRKQEEESRNKVAEITKVEFLDKDGKEKNVFETGDTLIVEIEYEFRKQIQDPVFGIVIRDDARNNVYALNTLYKRIGTGFVEKGKKLVSFLIENYFANGTYSVSPAVATKDQINLDWKDNYKSFKIVNKNFDSRAIADFKTNIIIK